ncbi:thiamine pyrophosphate-dependent enzyme [Streptomyces cucumeris]|uniref:thiamine pyrophosphate-dependent enzyme n=1 Tax=Streptomyces cucumeris TaxID=2962890 RepID=UPI003EBF50F3
MAGVNKTEAIQEVVSATAGRPVVFTTGYACRIAQHIADRPGHFYMTGSMGLAASVGTGVALATGTPTVVVDGDGSLLMNPVGLVSAGAIPDLRLIHVALDDGAYASTGGQAVPSDRTDLAAWARACGYAQVLRAEDPGTLGAMLREALAHCAAPVFLHCALTASDAAVPPRVRGDLGDHQRRFSRHLATSAPHA